MGRPKASYDTSSPEYQAWVDMRRRCNNPNHPAYPNYGARGITVHPSWQSFPKFLADVGKRPSAHLNLDRIDNNGNYEPGNVRWATYVQQNNNRRDNVMLTIGTVTHTVSEWSRISGVEVSLLHWRIRKGWPVHKLLSPTRAYHRL